jgi:hypothetical protein
MTTDVLMWVCGGIGTAAVAFLGAIWSEIRSLRSDITEMVRIQASQTVRIGTLETVIEKLPCYREFVCHHTHN